MCFDLNKPYAVQAYPRKESEQYGRKLYQLIQNEQQYWLKYQQTDELEQYSQIHIDGWQRELLFYHKHKDVAYVLPSQMIDLAQLRGIDARGQGMLLPHKNYYFTSAPQNVCEAQQRIKAVCQVLFQFHALGYVHGDIKKHHFLADLQGLYLIDFEHSFYDGTEIVGTHATPRYMAPELFHGALKTQESDFYALGIVVYEWLTHKKLFAKDYHDWAVLHCQCEFYTLPEVYKGLQPILDIMLSKRVEQRKQCLQQLKSILNQQIA
ncbi:protein kinase domain-containing protein [Acinetobacter rathckeae]|uniref:protein kinase domain-containing protein n=1 Tax=Acinetobacter rathckeae TaxID=2605272 RepID=UPI0018A26859|nr:lipopolysaccharide kinase InaA family protein [Acinetobacter rathckeae]MBF7695001.1 protein kinase [Acinetobacter rathckeae]